MVSGRVENRMLSTLPSSTNCRAIDRKRIISGSSIPKKLPPKKAIWTELRPGVRYFSQAWMNDMISKLDGRESVACVITF